MNQTDLTNLLSFAESNHLFSTPFQEVYNLWLKDLKEAYDDYLADLYLSSPEATEIPYIDQAV